MGNNIQFAIQSFPQSGGEAGSETESGIWQNGVWTDSGVWDDNEIWGQ